MTRFGRTASAGYGTERPFSQMAGCSLFPQGNRDSAGVRGLPCCRGRDMIKPDGTERRTRTFFPPPGMAEHNKTAAATTVPLTVLVPVFEDWPAADLLVQELDRVLGQGGRFVEVVLVDDG